MAGSAPARVSPWKPRYPSRRPRAVARCAPSRAHPDRQRGTRASTDRKARREPEAHHACRPPFRPVLSLLYSLRRPRRGLFMANIASQKKRNARSERERQENLRFRSSVKTHFRRLEAAVQSGDANTVAAEHKALLSRIDKAVQRGALHRNTGARKKSRAASIAGAASEPQSQS